MPLKMVVVEDEEVAGKGSEAMAALEGGRLWDGENETGSSLNDTHKKAHLFGKVRFFWFGQT